MALVGRARCARCERPLPSCLCRWVRPTANRIAVQVLQHPREAGHAKGSLPLLRLSLQRLQVSIGYSFDAAALPPGRWWLLYPGEAAEPADAAGRPAGPLADPAACGLLVLDGTWRQTRQLLHDNPGLRRLPRWPLPAPPPSRYAIRKTQRPGQLSTLEATCLALGALEGNADRYAPLLAAFEGWIAEELARRPPRP